VLPPKLAPYQVVIVPIPKPSPELTEAAEKIAKALKAHGVRVKIDTDDQNRPGFKFAEYEMIGVPVRLGLGQRDLAANQVEVARRDTKEKSSVSLDGIGAHIAALLDEIQNNLFERAKAYRAEHITRVDTMAELQSVLDGKGGFAYAHWDGTTETELAVKELTKATIRCIPIGWPDEAGACVLTGKPSERRVLFARSY
jgi:prolyl-tRNA synthetase